MVVSNDLCPIVIKTIVRRNGRMNVCKRDGRQRRRVLVAMAIDDDVEGIRKWKYRKAL